MDASPNQPRFAPRGAIWATRDRATIAAAIAIAIAIAAAATGCQRHDRDGPGGAATAGGSATAGAAATAATGDSSRTVPPLPSPLPGTRTDVTTAIDEAQRAAIADLDGDGRNEIIVADAQQLRVLDAAGHERASMPVPGGIQILVAARLDGDRRAAILAGWGISREHRQAPARVDVYRLDGDGARLAGETILTPTTTRNDIAAIVPLADEPGAILIAYFDSKYTVRSVIARRGAPWRITDVATFRTATAYARGDLDGDGKPDLVVGRVYGDDVGSPGEAFVLRDDGTRVPLPTTRGVRELAIADADGDGRPELFVADGWHQDYGRLGRGLLTWIRRVDGTLRAELIEDTPGQYTVGKLLPSDVDGDGRVELVTTGSHYVRLFDRRSGRWEGTTLAGAARDVAAGDLDGVPGDELLILGPRAEIVSLREHVTRGR